MMSYAFKSVFLSGMPCTGKDTLSERLCELDPALVHFKKHKADPRVAIAQPIETDKYILISHERFLDKIARSEFLQFHSRYRRCYGVSAKAYAEQLDRKRVPIIHVGRYENLAVLRAAVKEEAMSTLLWCDQAVAKERLMQ